MSKRLTPMQVKAIKTMLHKGSFSTNVGSPWYLSGKEKIGRVTMRALSNKGLVNVDLDLSTATCIQIATLTDRGREIAIIHKVLGKEEPNGSSKDA